jgi:alpha-tubulin suppressor-like RCC1 family protein
MLDMLAAFAAADRGLCCGLQSFREMWGFISSGSDSQDAEVTTTPPPPTGPAAPPGQRVSFGPHGKGAAVRSLACGLAHSAAIVGDGELWTWGCNHKGQCGHVVTGPGTGTVPPRVEEQEAAGDADRVVEAAKVETVHDALKGGGVSLLACGAEFTAAYSADTHTLAVCGAGANEFLPEGSTRAADGSDCSWHEIPLVYEEGHEQVPLNLLTQLAAGYGHLVMLSGPPAGAAR